MFYFIKYNICFIISTEDNQPFDNGHSVILTLIDGIDGGIST